MISEKFQLKLDEMEKLLRKTQNPIDLETQIQESINTHKRNTLTEGLKTSMLLIENFATKTVRTEFIKHENLVVNSRYNYWTRGGKPVEGYIATIIPDTPICLLINQWGPHQLAYLDNPETRITYLSEFRERCSLLLDKLNQGQLDHLLDKPPNEILHMINGSHGELLQELGIDPTQSYTIKKLIEQEQPRLIVIEVLNSAGQGINGAVVEYHQARWRRLMGATGEQYRDGWLSGLTDKEAKRLQVRINNKGNVYEKIQDLEKNRTFIFQTKRVHVYIRGTDETKGIPDAHIIVKVGDETLREAYTDENGEAFFELFQGKYIIEIHRNHASLTKTIQLDENMQIKIQTGRAHSNSGKCSHYYFEEWHTFSQDMELLPNNYYFKFNDGTQDTMFFVRGGTVNQIH